MYVCMVCTLSSVITPHTHIHIHILYISRLYNSGRISLYAAITSENSAAERDYRPRTGNLEHAGRELVCHVAEQTFPSLQSSAVRPRETTSTGSGTSETTGPGQDKSF